MILLEQLTLAHLFEFMAAVSGSFYLWRTKDTSIVRYFVWFLWLTFSVEFFALYAGIAYYSDYEIFSFIEGTPFSGNYWLYNIYSIIAFAVYILFFSSLLRNNVWKGLLFILVRLYVLAAIINLIFSDVYFMAHSIFTFFVGTIIVIISIGLYYFELLKSDEILSVKTSVPFYISVGALIYHLGFVPLVIYSRYYNIESPKFVEIYIFILHGINYILYSIYTLGFILCSKKKRSS